MKNSLVIVFTLLSFVGFSQAEANETLFSEATENYNSGDFQGAIDKYVSILKSGSESSSLYYNLANAHYKLNQLPESIYYYEKSLMLNPNNEDAKNNLIFAQQMVIDNIVPLPKTWFKELSDSFTGLFSLNTWAIISILSVWGVVVSFLLYYFLQATILKRIFFVLTLGMLVVGVGTYFIADFHKKNIEDQKYAILFDKTVRIFSEPNSYSSEAFTLHEGTKVKIIEKLDDWVKIKLADGKEGWMKETSLRTL